MIFDDIEHLVFMLDAAVSRPRCADTVQREYGEPFALECAEVAARALDVHNGDGLARRGVDLVDLCGGVAAAEVGDAAVTAEHVGALEKASISEFASMSCDMRLF